jgi:hypothetical protein
MSSCVQDADGHRSAYALIAAASLLRNGMKTVRGVNWASRGYQTSARKPSVTTNCTRVNGIRCTYVKRQIFGSQSVLRVMSHIPRGFSRLMRLYRHAEEYHSQRVCIRLHLNREHNATPRAHRAVAGRTRLNEGCVGTELRFFIEMKANWPLGHDESHDSEP